MPRKGSYKNKSPVVGMPAANPYMGMPLTTTTGYKGHMPTTADLIAARNAAASDALISENVPMSVLERARPERIDQ